MDSTQIKTISIRAFMALTRGDAFRIISRSFWNAISIYLRWTIRANPQRKPRRLEAKLLQARTMLALSKSKVTKGTNRTKSCVNLTVKTDSKSILAPISTQIWDGFKSVEELFWQTIQGWVHRWATRQTYRQGFTITQVVQIWMTSLAKWAPVA